MRVTLTEFWQSPTQYLLPFFAVYAVTLNYVCQKHHDGTVITYDQIYMNNFRLYTYLKKQIINRS